MKISISAVILGLAAYAVAAPAVIPHVVHERRNLLSDKWARSDIKLPRDAVIPLSIGLTQRNLEHGENFLMDVSHPSSSNYGKHWSEEKIIETFAASDETITAVKTWLIGHGIDSLRITLSKGKNWIKFNATIEEAESLLQTKYHAFSHSASGEPYLACDEYSVPANIRNHIDFITPTVQFDAIIKERKRKRSFSPQSGRVGPFVGGKANPEALPITQITYNTANCNKYTTPDCLRLLYNLPNGTLALSSYGIVEYTPQAFRQADLNTFYLNLQRQIPSGYGPTIDLIDGAVVQTTTASFNDNGESDLDIEYAIALVYPQKVTLYQVGDTVAGASFGNFLDALDASYCTSGGGDDPKYDSVYPDTGSGGYKGAENCGTIKPASVISTSYGYNEADLPAAYEHRQCNEYMKLGLAGTTFLFSSGDSGVAGNSGQCCTKKGCAGGTYNSGGSGSFNPSFPSTCPYVTSVGATQIVPGASVTSPEQACETVIYSGGGFSNNFAIPSYQSMAVASYFSAHKPTYSATQYNNSGIVRGYPDISANGANYVIAVDGSLQQIYGTSASSPVVGSIITLINQHRISAGKAPVGFINPVLYANPAALNDITSGGNQGCGTTGFSAVAGWDPVTGLGTPNYPKLLSAFLALP